MPPAPLPPGKKKFFCTLPPQFIMPPAPLPPGCKKTILSHFIQFQHYGEKDTLAYREMKLLLPGGSGAGGTINWGGRVQNHFSDLTFFFILNLKILPIWFSQVSRCHLKGFHSRISKQGLLFGIFDFSIFKICSELVNLWVGHLVVSVETIFFWIWPYLLWPLTFTS